MELTSEVDGAGDNGRILHRFWFDCRGFPALGLG